MEYLSGEWLFQSCYKKEHRYKWYLCAANFKKNDKDTVIPATMISYEWNTLVSLDIFCLLKVLMALGGGEEGIGNCPIFSFLCLPLKLKTPQMEKPSEKK